MMPERGWLASRTVLWCCSIVAAATAAGNGPSFSQSICRLSPVALKDDELVLPDFSSGFNGFQSASQKSDQILHVSLSRPEGNLTFGRNVLDGLTEGSSDAAAPLAAAGCNQAVVECRLELIACALCQIKLNWTRALQALRRSADRFYCDPLRSASRCIRLSVVESAADTRGAVYREYEITDKNNFADGTFTSSGYKLTLALTLCRNDADTLAAMDKLFPIGIHVQENTELHRGLPGDRAIGYIKSPRYPNAYPTGIIKNYTLMNTGASSRACVRLIFDDFQLNYLSILKVLDTDGTVLFSTDKSTRSMNRPPPIQSSGSSLTVVFEGNHYTNPVGFRATYEFVADSYWPQKPNDRSCDSVLENAGGVISIQSSRLPVQSYVDCVWIIRKGQTKLFNEIYVKVENFEVQSDSDGIRLEVHDRVYSESEPRLDVYGPKSNQELRRSQSEEGFITGAPSRHSFIYSSSDERMPAGFYIRLRGFVTAYDGLSIVYAQFYRWHNAMCNDRLGENFHCDNKRCIERSLVCDAGDHCGDYSDERTCHGHGKTGGGLTDVRQVSRGGSASRTSISYDAILVIVCVLVVLVGCIITVGHFGMYVVARLYRRRLISHLHSEQQQQQQQHHQHAVHQIQPSRQHGTVQAWTVDSDSRATMQRLGDRRFYMLPDTEVGVLEAPPAYDDALKHPSVPSNASNASASTLRPHSEVIPTRDEEQEAGPSTRQSAPAGLSYTHQSGCTFIPNDDLSSVTLRRGAASSDDCSSEQPEESSVVDEVTVIASEHWGRESLSGSSSASSSPVWSDADEQPTPTTSTTGMTGSSQPQPQHNHQSLMDRISRWARDHVHRQNELEQTTTTTVDGSQSAEAEPAATEPEQPPYYSILSHRRRSSLPGNEPTAGAVPIERSATQPNSPCHRESQV